MEPRDGFYGQFGGSFIPAKLQKNIDELNIAFNTYVGNKDFMAEYANLLANYVGRPSPLYLSAKLSAKYGCKVYFKREDLNHTGSHKINNTLGQILLARYMGKRRIIAETGAGSHGVAVATVCALMDMECVVYMGQTDIERQQHNVERMRYLGADVVASVAGSATLTSAVDAALEHWCENSVDTFYLLGSAVGPAPYPQMVAHFQSVISSEIRAQLLQKEGRETPDMVIACIGGGSNAVGAFFNFIEDKDVILVAAEAGGKGEGQNAASMSYGSEAILHGSRNLVLLDKDKNPIEAYSISAGLDYPGVGPLPAYLYSTGRMKAVATTDSQALDAASMMSRSEGIIPALESAHAIAALELVELPKNGIVVVNLSGRGDKDLALLMES